MVKKIVIIPLSISAFILVGCSESNMFDQQTTAQNNPQATQVAGPQQMVGTSKGATLSALNMNSQGSEIESKPSQKISVSVNYTYHCAKCNPTANNQILVGLAGRSAQACIYDGGNTNQGTANFELKTPAVPGAYEVRFRTAQAENCQEALKSWWSVDGTPSQNATIGKIEVVTLKT